MSKSYNILKMLNLLRSRGKMKIGEIAERLDVSPRMVREYKKEIESFHIDIRSETGKDGGYYMGEFDSSILSLGINEHDFFILNMAKSYLKQENFVFIKEYEQILDKINAKLKGKKDIVDVGGLILQATPDVDIKEEKMKYNKVQEAILNSKKLKIRYSSLKSGLKDRIIRAYGMYIYQGFWYIVAHCEKANDIRYFKLVRVEEIQVLKDEFLRPEDFSLKEYFKGTIGLMRDDKSFNIKLKIDYPTSVKVSERIWVEGQKVNFNEDNSIIFEAEMTGIDDIVNWVLSLGAKVEVLKPDGLRDRVKEEARKIMERND